MDEGSHERTGSPETVPLANASDGSGPSGGANILPGTRYQLERLLGDGGSGQVFRGLHLELDKPVAIKVLHGEVSHDADYASRFRREAKAASRICHPGVVAVTDFGTADDGRLFLVMELIEGQTLAEAIQRGPLGAKRALKVAANLCDILAAIHDSGIVHRDIKPANIFLLEHDQAKVVDFGIARGGALGGADWRITQTGKVVGTPGYMAPEHARAQPADGRADLYSLGAVLYEMLTGIAPFRGDSPVDVLMAQMVKRPEPPSKVLRQSYREKSIPRALDRAVRKLLAVKPEDRFQSAAEVAAVLRGIGDELGPETGNVSPSSQKGRGGHILKIAVAAMAAMGLLAGGVVGFWLLDTAVTDEGRDAPGLKDEQMRPLEAGVMPEENVAGFLATPAASQDSSATSADMGLVEENSIELPTPLQKSTRARPRPSPVKAHQGSAPDGASPPTESPQVLLQKARIAAASSRWGEAERLFEQAQNSGADRGAVLSGLGQVALARGQHVRAVRLLEQSSALRPGSIRILLDLGRAYRGSGQVAHAIEQWRAVIRRDPDNAHARRLLRAAGAEPE